MVGFTNVNPETGVIKGQSGIEEEYNSLLTGTAGSEQVMRRRGRRGDPAGGHARTRPPRTASPIKLTIIPALQFEAQQACQQEVAKTKAANCSVVIMQPKTGAILAMAQWPTYDQNTLTNVARHDRHTPTRTCSTRAPPPR